MSIHIDSKLLQRFFGGYCSPRENQVVNTYIQGSAGKRHLFLFLKMKWDLQQEEELNLEELADYKSLFWRLVEEEMAPVNKNRSCCFVDH